MKYFLFLIVTVWMIAVFASCASKPAAPEPPLVYETGSPGSTPGAGANITSDYFWRDSSSQVHEYTAFWPNKEYTASLAAILSGPLAKDLLNTVPKDAEYWCYNKYPDKIQFYLSFISAMSKYESNWSPDTTYSEPDIFDRHGNHVVSTGLLQVSSESCSGYGMKYLSNSELKKPENNFECAVRILSRWIMRDGVIASDLKGAARYWSVVRPGAKHKKEQIRKMVCIGF